MPVLHRCCCGLDVHKRFVVACLIWSSEDGKPHKELQRFDTLTPELLRLIAWLQSAECAHVALESTGVYWKPIFNLLEGLFEIVLVNAQHMKAVPGRKTDTKDAEWIADLLQHGLLKASFIPPQPQRDLRDLTRSPSLLKQERTRHVNRVHKLVEETNIKLSSVFADMMCQTGRAMLHALARGEGNPEVLADLARLRAPQKPDALVPALIGCMRAHHRFLLQELLGMIDTLERAIGRLDHEIEERLRQKLATSERLDAITGVSQRVLETLFAEVGWELDTFADAAHLASWVGICPGQHESGGKRMSGRVRKGNRYAKTILVQAAHAAGKTKTYLGAQDRRMSKGRGIKRAAVAVGHSILVIYYPMLTTSQPYQEKGEDYARPLRSAREAKATGQAAGAAWVYGPVDTRARRLASFFPAESHPGSEKGVFLCFFRQMFRGKALGIFSRSQRMPLPVHGRALPRVPDHRALRSKHGASRVDASGSCA